MKQNWSLPFLKTVGTIAAAVLCLFTLFAEPFYVYIAQWFILCSLIHLELFLVYRKGFKEPLPSGHMPHHIKIHPRIPPLIRVGLPTWIGFLLIALLGFFIWPDILCCSLSYLSVVLLQPLSISYAYDLGQCHQGYFTPRS